MRLVKFIGEVCARVAKNDLIAMANELTFKLMLSVFPFIIFVITIIAHLKIEYSEYVDFLLSDVPADISRLIYAFLDEAVYTRPAGLMSVSLFVALFSASSGFHSFIKGLNRAYGVREKRNFVYTRIIALFLVLLLSMTIMLAFYILILGGQINEMLFTLNIIDHIPKVNAVEIKILMAVVFTVVIVLVYQIGANIQVRVIDIMPGTFFTMGAWFILSKLFNIYITKFARYSALYGSIGALFVFSLWLNVLCFALLIGCQGNAVLCDKEFMEELFEDGRENKAADRAVQPDKAGNIDCDNRPAGNN